MRTIKLFLLVLAAVLMLSACAAPKTPASPTPVNDDAALRDQMEALTGKVEQLQDKISDLEQENRLLQNDSTATAADDLTYLLDEISRSGQTVTSFPALITAISGSGDEFTLQIDRLEYNPDYEPGGLGNETYLINADRFTYVYYDGYLLPELDEGLSEYLTSDGVEFTVYMLGGKAIYLSEITVS